MKLLKTLAIVSLTVVVYVIELYIGKQDNHNYYE